MEFWKRSVYLRWYNNFTKNSMHIYKIERCNYPYDNIDDDIDEYVTAFS